ncbi:MAG: IS66 family insertion sequence element accessory protein TnpB [Magnetococcales bacterium]|nr:IS66 family insertion sequence element accessory protein TnpB [Magnetococcales bacterium]MBF0322798.1 IS66 family insertion sequence element accessory protein TnpB [Magnetococcales bacterium]
MGLNPFDDNPFVFRNHHRDKAKILYWEGSGWLNGAKKPCKPGPTGHRVWHAVLGIVPVGSHRLVFRRLADFAICSTR